MHAPQIIYIVLVGIGLLITAAKHGEPKGDYNIGVQIIADGLMIGLLIWGGFFAS